MYTLVGLDIAGVLGNTFAKPAYPYGTGRTEAARLVSEFSTNGLLGNPALSCVAQTATNGEISTQDKPSKK